jgi:putative transposase
MENKTYYRRHLPHYQPSTATFFVTFRLAGSLPAAAIEKMRIDRQLMKQRIEDIADRKIRSDEWHVFNDEYFSRFDELLDKGFHGPRWLREPEIALIVRNALHFYDNKRYDLLCFCIMSNHVHVVLDVDGISNLINHEGRNDLW